jgi:hypothetical protein
MTQSPQSIAEADAAPQPSPAEAVRLRDLSPT